MVARNWGLEWGLTAKGHEQSLGGDRKTPYSIQIFYIVVTVT